MPKVFNEITQVNVTDGVGDLYKSENGSYFILNEIGGDWVCTPLSGRLMWNGLWDSIEKATEGLEFIAHSTDYNIKLINR